MPSEPWLSTGRLKCGELLLDGFRWLPELGPEDGSLECAEMKLTSVARELVLDVLDGVYSTWQPDGNMQGKFIPRLDESLR
jgi:hypothetical protein